MPCPTVVAEISEHYDKLFHPESEVYKAGMEAHYEPVKKFLDIITSNASSPNNPNSPSIPSPANILDVGCGNGEPVASYFVEKGHNLTGIDYLPAFIERATATIKKRNADQKVSFINIEMTEFEPPAGEKYDLILAVHLFYHTPVADIRSMFFQFINWLKPGGLLFVVSALPEEFEDQEHWSEGLQHNFLGNIFNTVTLGTPAAWRHIVNEFGFQIVQEEEETFKRGFEEEGGGHDYQICLIVRRPVDSDGSTETFNPFHGPFPLEDKEHVGPAVDITGIKTLYALMDINRVLRDIDNVLKQRNLNSVGYVGLDLFKFPSDIWGDINSFDLMSPSPPPASSEPTSLLLFWALHRRPLQAYFKEITQRLHIHLDKIRTIIAVQAAPDSEVFYLVNKAAQNVPGFHPFEHGYILRFAEKQFKELGFGKVTYLSSEATFRFGENEDSDEAKVKEAVRLMSGTLKKPSAQDEEGCKNWNAFEKNLEELTRGLFIHSHGLVRNRVVLLIAERE